jgi:signal transduction histidine kinase
MSAELKEERLNLHPAVEDLLSVPALSDLSTEDLEWLTSQMETITLDAGDTLFSGGDPADHLLIVFSGEIRAEREDGRVYTARGGQITGYLPYSRLTVYPSTAKAIVPTRGAKLHKQKFQEVLARIPVLQQRLVYVLSDRVRESTAIDQQLEKLSALGKLSAGLAHELNNPASAACRAADNLKGCLAALRESTLKLDQSSVSPEARIFLSRLEMEWAGKQGPQSALDSLDRSEREDEFTGWLKRHQFANGWEVAPALVEAGCTLDALEEIAKRVPDEYLRDALCRLTASFTASRLAEEIENSVSRISELVQAVKEYSYMDQVPAQEVDVHDGIESTLVMLRHRLKTGIEILRDYDRTLPKVSAHGSELNQVWTNLIANAADAMKGRGKLQIKTGREDNWIVVQIIDNGPGIPEAIQHRIFEPFFTTKSVGEGTGLGLDVVRRIIQSHSGSVDAESKPGATRFTVRIPVRRSPGQKV